MRNFNFSVLSLTVLALAFLVVGCHMELNPIQTFGNEAIKDGKTDDYNYKMLGSYMYNQVKYHMKSNARDLMPEIGRKHFDESFDKIKATYDKEHWTVPQTISYLTSQGYYSQKQASAWLDQHNKLLKYLESRPSKTDFNKWKTEREKEIINLGNLSPDEKSKILNERTLINSIVYYKLEMMPDNTTQSPSARLSSACGFWEKLSCWVGYVSGITGLGGGSGQIAALFTESTRLVTQWTGIGAAIGVAVGVAEAIQGCNCDMNTCDVSEGLNFDYKCYTPGDNLLYQAWGYGNITPSQFEFQFYKNNDLSNGSNFWGDITSGVDYITIPGYQLTNNNVQTLAVRSINYCSGTPKIQTFGWYDLSELGKPYFVLDGPSTITWANAPNVNYLYVATGAITKAPNTTISWQVIPSGYPGYSATGTIVMDGGSNSTDAFIRWDSTPGIAFVKVTATSPCGTWVDQYTVRIQ